MPNLEYFRPTKMKDAIDLIQKAEPLAGGTSITPRRDSIAQVVDVQDLGLDGFHVEGERIEIGAACKLQSLIEHGTEIPGALVAACRLEAGLNMRQMSSHRPGRVVRMCRHVPGCGDARRQRHPVHPA